MRTDTCLHRPGQPEGSISLELKDTSRKGCSLSEKTPVAVPWAGRRHHRGEKKVNEAFKCYLHLVGAPGMYPIMVSSEGSGPLYIKDPFLIMRQVMENIPIYPA